jgi:ribonuclease P protein component
MVRGSNAANLSPAKSQAPQSSRLPSSNGDPLGPRDAGASQKEGPSAFDGQVALQARRPVTGSEGFTRRQRLVSGDQLRAVTSRGRRQRTEYLDISWVANDAGHPRLGLIVPKFQSTAVARNRLRRRLREWWRRRGQFRVGAVDVVLRAKPAAYRARFPELGQALDAWTERVGPDR